MNPLDEPISQLDSLPVSLWPTILKYGLIGGFASIIITFANFQITLLEKPFEATTIISLVFTAILLILYILVMIFAVKEYRDKKNDGYINLGKGMLTAFGSAMIMGTIGLFFSLLYLLVINPGFYEQSLTGAYEGLSTTASSQFNYFTPKLILVSQLSSYIMGAIVGALLSLVVAAIMKKDRPVWK